MIFDTRVSPRSVFFLSLGGVNATSTKSYVPVNRLHPIKNTQGRVGEGRGAEGRGGEGRGGEGRGGEGRDDGYT